MSTGSEGTAPAQPTVAPAPANGNGNGLAGAALAIIKACGVQMPALTIVCATGLGGIYLLRDSLATFNANNAEAIKAATEPCQEAERRSAAAAEKTADAIGMNTEVLRGVKDELERLRRDRKR